MKNTSVMFVDIFMIQKSVIQMAAFNLVLPLKIFQKIGYVLFVVLAKRIFRLLQNNLIDCKDRSQPVR